MISRHSMKSKIIAVAVLSGTCLILFLCNRHWFGWKSQGSSPTTAALTVDSDEWDFGVVPQEQGLLTHTFTLLNSGSEIISVKPIHIGCSCLAVECPDSIAPGARCSVKVDVEIRGREGDFATHLDLGTSDAALPELELRLRFHAIPPVIVEPAVLQFPQAIRGEPLELEFRIITRREVVMEPTRCPEILPSSPALRCESIGSEISKAVSPGGFRRENHRYRIRIDTKALAEGDSPRARAVLHYRLAESPPSAAQELPIEITFIHHKLVRGQTAVTLQRGDRDKQVRVRLWSADGKPFTIQGAKGTLPGISAHPASTEPAKVQDLLVSFSGSKTGKQTGILKGHLDVQISECPEDPYRVDVLVLPQRR